MIATTSARWAPEKKEKKTFDPTKEKKILYLVFAAAVNKNKIIRFLQTGERKTRSQFVFHSLARAKIADP